MGRRPQLLHMRLELLTKPPKSDAMHDETCIDRSEVVG